MAKNMAIAQGGERITGTKYRIPEGFIHTLGIVLVLKVS
jgi:hypothetical protein